MSKIQLYIAIRFCIAGALLVTTAVGEDAKQSEAKSRRFLLLTSQGPLIVDLAIHIDGELLGSKRERIIRRAIESADTNKDDMTSWDEAADSGQFDFGNLKHLAKSKPKSFRRRLRLFDEDGNGAVDFAEASRLWALYTGAGELVSFISRNRIQSRVPFSPILFACLDVDNDRVLSAEEIAACRQRLMQQDANNNEILDTNELSRFGKQAGAIANNSTRVLQPSILLVDDVDAEFLRGQLQTVYPMDHRKKDSPKLYRQFMKQLDANEDGKLATDELAAIGSTAAHLDLEIQLGDHDARRPARLRSISPNLSEIGTFLTAGSTVVVRLETLQIQFIFAGRTLDADIASQARRLFATLDRDTNGYLDRAEIKKSNFSSAIELESWDTDSDGKVTTEELTTYYVDKESAQRRAVSIQTVPRARVLWNWLNVNGDHRLSLRELHSAETYIRSCDRNNDKEVSLDEIPATVTLRIAPQSTEIPIQRRPFGLARPIDHVAVGPKWFIRMDRNRDGDVSRREFLGDPEQFKQYDQDGDGLIDPDEAAAQKRKTSWTAPLRRACTTCRVGIAHQLQHIVVGIAHPTLSSTVHLDCGPTIRKSDMTWYR